MFRRPPFRFLSLTFVASLLAACGGGSQDDAGGAFVTNADGQLVGKAAGTAAGGTWGALKTLPFSPASMANLPDGRLLLWAADGRLTFGGGTTSYTALFDPVAETLTEKLMNETGQNMFCPGTSNLPDGRVLISGGSVAAGSTVYDPATNRWSSGGNYVTGRAYQANTVLRDGTVFSFGGSWAGGVGGKGGELWTSGTGWKALPGVPVDDAMTADVAGAYRADNHMWLIPTGNGKVLHAGPSVKMHWITTEGSGGIVPAGNRADDLDSMSGTAVMFDTGRILKAGGSPNYESGATAPTNASPRAYLLDARRELTVRRLQDMSFARAFHNSVVLPNGQVLVVGGQSVPVPFSDANSALRPELFDPATETWTQLPAMAQSRNYHSIAVLLPDARVISSGGNLGSTGTAHSDYQIYTPGYLFDASGAPARRPVITAAPAQAAYGTTVTVTTDSDVTSMALVRLNSTTHTVNNDQRRLSLAFTATGANTYAVSVPSNPGWAIPGNYMLFAMNAAGVPSVAKIVRIDLLGAPMVARVDDQFNGVGTTVSLALSATGTGLTWSATGLPDGLAIDRATGRITGSPRTEGRFAVTVAATNGSGTVSTEFLWTVKPTFSARYIRLATTGPDINGGPWASAAEIEVIDVWGNPIPRDGWVATASSANVSDPIANAIDGNTATFWHSQWEPVLVNGPHHYTIDLGKLQRIGAIRYLPRQDGWPNGNIDGAQVFVSDDGQTWGAPVWSGKLSTLGAATAWKTVRLNELARGKPAVQSSTYIATNGPAVAARAVDGNLDGWTETVVTHTLADTNAWWQVDLGSTQNVQAVRLWNRTDCCFDRLTNAYVFVSDLDMGTRSVASLLADPSVKAMNYPGTVPAWTELVTAAGGYNGRYVRVQLGGTNFLSLAEVQVFGRPDVAGPVTPVNRPPVWGTLPDLTGDVGVTAGALLRATDPDGDTLAYTATGLPTGLAINAATGQIAGAPTAAGTYAVSVTATDPSGLSATANFTWAVRAAQLSLPALTLPMSTAGSTLAFDPGNLGAGLSYRWDWGDGTSTTGTTGAAAKTYAAPGVYTVTLTVTAADGRVTARTYTQAVAAKAGYGAPRASSGLLFEPNAGRGMARYVKIEQVTEVNGNPWASMAEFDLLDDTGALIDRRGWSIAGLSSEETAGGNGRAVNAIDGDPATIWHTAWSTTVAQRPHWLTIDTGRAQWIGGFRYLPRQDGIANGTFAGFRLWFSLDGVNWTTPVLEGNLQAAGGPPAQARTATLPSRVWTVNPDSGTVGVHAAGTWARSAEIAVGKSPRTLTLAANNEVWVANAEGDSITAIDATTLAVKRTIATGRATTPWGLVYDPVAGTVTASLESRAALQTIDAGTGALGATIATVPRPRHLALTRDRASWLVPAFVTPLQPGESTARIDAAAAATVGLIDRNAGTMARIGLRLSDKADGEAQGRGLPNYLGAPALSPDGASAWIPSKQDNIQRGLLRDGLPLNFQNTVRAISSRIDLASRSEDYPARIDHDNAGVASAAVHHPSGVYLFVALENIRAVAVVDAVGKKELMRVPVGRAPQALSVSPDGLLLAVSNFMDRSITVLDLGPLVNQGQLSVPVLATMSSRATETLAADVFKGKQFFYDAADARLARDGYLSCATCHRDGDHDGRVWDLSGQGEGLRRTPSLLGKGTGHGSIHWSANFDEFQDFEGQIRALAGGTGLLTDADFAATSSPLGQPKAGRNADLDALAAYLRSLDRAPASPARAATGALTADGVTGQALFGTKCASCHAGGAFTDSALGNTWDVGTLKATSGQRLNGPLKALDVPSLRGAWRANAWLHDGSAATIEAAISAHTLPTGVLSTADIASLANYVRQIDADEQPNAGWLNAARGRTATQSSTATANRVSLAASFAVDGNLDGSVATQVTQTNSTANAWWQVDLGTVQRLDSIRIWNRTDCCTTRLANFVVFVSATDMTGRSYAQLQADATVFKSAYPGTVGRVATIPLPAAGRYVRIMLAGTNVLSLAEVEVFAAVPTNLAAGKAAKQSSIYNNLVASRGVDGVTNGNGEATIFHTLSDLNAWWQVDLGAVSDIGSVKLWNRTDCCTDRAQNVWVLASSTDPTGRTLAQLLADPAVSKVQIPGMLPPNVTVPLPTRARYVRVQLPNTNFLHLSEVQVWPPGAAP